MNEETKKIQNIFNNKVELQNPINQQKQERISQLIVSKTIKEGTTKNEESR